MLPHVRSPRMVAECLLTRSMLIKMYYHFMACAYICTIIYTVSQFLADVYLVFIDLEVQIDPLQYPGDFCRV